VNHLPEECEVLGSLPEKPNLVWEGADMAVGKGGLVDVVMATSNHSFP
jgi:hypothetical protein